MYKVYLPFGRSVKRTWWETQYSSRRRVGVKRRHEDNESSLYDHPTSTVPLLYHGSEMLVEKVKIGLISMDRGRFQYI